VRAARNGRLIDGMEDALQPRNMRSAFLAGRLEERAELAVSRSRGHGWQLPRNERFRVKHILEGRNEEIVQSPDCHRTPPFLAHAITLHNERKSKPFRTSIRLSSGRYQPDSRGADSVPRRGNEPQEGDGTGGLARLLL
jgi:hypothetical protein